MNDLKLDGLGKKERMKFKNLSKEREKIIASTPLENIKVEYNTNEVARSLHPKLQYVKVIDIINESNDVKTFLLAPNDEKGTKKLAYFKAGQYVTVRIRIGKCLYKRPYTLSCSPKLALKNRYTITIKRKEEGVVSNYFFNNITIGSSFVISAPNGTFCYERIRDAKNVIAIAGGSGITPFISMAEAINDQLLNFNLTILYGAKTTKDLIFKERLDKLSTNGRIKVKYILSEEESDKYERGFIEKETIEPYLVEENSFFVCGPMELYKHMNEVLKEYNLAKKFIRTDLFFSEIELRREEEFNVKIITKDKEFNINCNGQETLLSAIEKNGILAPSSCHVGVCGLCRSKLLSGKIKTFDSDIRASDKNLNYIHPCSSFPESDVVIKLPN